MEYRSRTQKKNEALSLKKLGEKLVELHDDQLKEIALPPEIFEAVTFAKTIKAHGGRRRQMQFIGALMRRYDVTAVQEAIQEIEQGKDRKAEVFQELEEWREGLMAGDEVLMDYIMKEYPEADRLKLSQLVRNAVKEKELGKPPIAFRALFKYLKKIRPETA